MVVHVKPQRPLGTLERAPALVNHFERDAHGCGDAVEDHLIDRALPTVHRLARLALHPPQPRVGQRLLLHERVVSVLRGALHRPPLQRLRPQDLDLPAAAPPPHDRERNARAHGPEDHGGRVSGRLARHVDAVDRHNNVHSLQLPRQLRGASRRDLGDGEAVLDGRERAADAAHLAVLGLARLHGLPAQQVHVPDLPVPLQAKGDARLGLSQEELLRVLDVPAHRRAIHRHHNIPYPDLAAEVAGSTVHQTGNHNLVAVVSLVKGAADADRHG
mmetsp:Transcript_67207/g.165888  ORF Transcript_67207/g.165888 Transcript_67207/m.165888 type:complete len:273 (-) Transcript_67207:60-878(-)